jgi:hypothetical protein
MEKPSIHRNGSSPESLIAGYSLVLEKLVETIRALEAEPPNARDYYPQGTNKFGLAVHEHKTRVEALCKVRYELVALMEHVQEQADARERQARDWTERNR